MVGPDEYETVDIGRSSGASDAPPAFHLGDAADTESPDDPPRPMARWVPMVAALVVGVVVGSVAATTRHDAADSTVIDLVAGAPNVQYLGPNFGGGGPIGFVFYNDGPREIEITGVELAGWVSSQEGRGTDPVIAPAGEWVEIPVRLTADCSLESDDVVHVGVRTATGAETVTATLPPINPSVRDAWGMACSPELGGFLVTGAETLIMSSDGDAVQMRVMIGQPTSSPSRIRVTRVRSRIAGFEVGAAALPLDIVTATFVPLDLTWTITQCELATRLTDAAIGLNVEDLDGQLPDSFIPISLSGNALVELARFSADHCET
ncbi:MAG TPA: hypothetical protein VFQ15_02575 [Jiangellaceae bacterium]|nr:hypothetical protein [Jiangellaceae bacterium]